MQYIRQAYLEDEARTRIRRTSCRGQDSFTVIRITEDEGSRQENEYTISEDVFNDLKQMAKCSLEKSRYLIPIPNGFVAELNIFHGSLAGYLQIEVEFVSEKEAKAFIPPYWFGQEVTLDSSHRNYHLAKYGSPQDAYIPEFPL